jgi:hypothetical protein
LDPSVEPARRVAAEIDDIALCDRALQARDTTLLARRADDLAPGLPSDRLVAARVVGMPVRVEDVGQLPALLVEGAQDRSDLGRVDARRHARGVVVDEEAVVVGQAGELMDLEPRHGGPQNFSSMMFGTMGCGCNEVSL